MPLSFAEVLWTARYDYQPEWTLERHKHSHYQIIYCLGGAGRFFLEDREYPLAQGALFLIKPRREHGLSPSSLVKTLDLKFTVSDRGLRRSLMKAREVAQERESGIAGLFEHIRSEGERQDPLYREMCSVFLLQILIRYLRHSSQSADAAEAQLGRRRRPASRRRGAAGDGVHTSQLCGRAQPRPDRAGGGQIGRRVRQRFEESLGASPMRYLMQYRFTRVFHEVAGATPGAWRRKYQAGICKDVVIDPRFSNTIRTVET